MISKSEAAPILDNYHYLSRISKGFKSGYNYGCFVNEDLVGVIIFTCIPVPELAVGMFGLERNDLSGLFELSRLCLKPSIQQEEHNLASWFISKSIKLLRKQTVVRAILSYADSKYHNGTVYAASNFKYYGLTDQKKDFFYRNHDGEFIKHSRGKVKNSEGEWRYRTRKHRFVIIYDKTLEIKWHPIKWHPIKWQIEPYKGEE